MPYLTIHKLEGDPNDLLTRKRANMDPIVDRTAPKHGAIFSVTARTEEGLLTINLWKSRQAAEAFTRDPEIRRARGESGLPWPSHFEHYENARFEHYEGTRHGTAVRRDDQPA